MAHHCECYRRIVLKSAARHARAGWIYRPGHDLCRKCWRSLVERQAVRTAVASGGGFPYWVWSRRNCSIGPYHSDAGRMKDEKC
jgi:hypothetical protein